MRSQRGVALLVALLMLLVMTLIGISSIGSTVYEAKISGNERFGSAAFYISQGGMDVGISRLPVISEYSEELPSGEKYRSGSMTDSTAKPMKSLGRMRKAGFEATWEFRRYQLNSTGEALGVQKEIETQVSLGPSTGSTLY